MTDVRPSLYRRHRFPAEIIAEAVWLYFRFPLSFRMVEDMLLTKELSSHTRRLGNGQKSSGGITPTRSAAAHHASWHLDECVVSINGKKCFLWRAVDQDGFVLEVLVQSRRDTNAAKRLIRKSLTKSGCAPRVMITDKLGS